MNLIYVWANVLLESYSNLVKFADAVDSEVRRVTLLGSSDRFNTMELSNYVIDLIEKKIALCNTKVLIEEIVRKMDKETQKSLFDVNIQKKDTISPILDDIKDKYGDNIIIPASLYEKEEVR